MIVSLTKSIHCFIKSRPRTKISGEWLRNEIDECMFHLQNAGFNVLAIVADDHASNVGAFSLLHKCYDRGWQIVYIPPNIRGLIENLFVF